MVRSPRMAAIVVAMLCVAGLAWKIASWPVIQERTRFILLGVYPPGQQWRPVAVCVLFVLLYLASAVRRWWPRMIAAWVAVPAAAVLLLRGGLLGLPAVSGDLWGGLPLTLTLATTGFAAAFPLAIALALGRRARAPVVRVLSVAYIEVLRGVPLVTFLFVAAAMIPLLLPPSVAVDKIVRAQVALVMVIAAHLAEVIRGGLNAVPGGQAEAAASLGLTPPQATALVVLPQALGVSIPALVNTFIAFFKDTSLVAVIGLFDLLGTARAVLADPKWLGLGAQVYIFAAAIYFAFCAAVSQYARRLERVLAAEAPR